MKSDSPVSKRLPAPMSAPKKPPLLLRAVAEDGFHLDAIVHVHHPARFGDRGFHGVEFDFDELHVVAENLVINFVHRGHRLFAFRRLCAECGVSGIRFPL